MFQLECYHRYYQLRLIRVRSTKGALRRLRQNIRVDEHINTIIQNRAQIIK